MNYGIKLTLALQNPSCEVEENFEKYDLIHLHAFTDIKVCMQVFGDWLNTLDPICKLLFLDPYLLNKSLISQMKEKSNKQGNKQIAES